MKKALSLGLSFALVASGLLFADEPVANVNVAEFSGNASVIWGVDLDNDNKTGFENKTDATLKLNLFDKGDKTSEGDGVWGEIKVKTDGYIMKNGEADKDGTASVDSAKLHFGDMLSVGITSGDTTVGEYKLVTAIANESIATSNVGADATAGITISATPVDMFSFNLDVRSTPVEAVEDDETTTDVNETVEGTKYTNEYAIAADATIKPITDLSVFLGGAYDLTEANKGDMGAAFNTTYKLAINDTMYVKPQAGFTYFKAGATGSEAATNLVAGVFLGWGEEGQKNKIYYATDKECDGFSVATNLDLAADTMVIPLTVAVWDNATLVDNLTFGAQLAATDISDFVATATMFAEAKYAAAVGEGTITPKAGINVTLLDKFTAAGKCGVEFAGFVDNTTFNVDLGEFGLGENKAKGTLDFTCKIAL